MDKESIFELQKIDCNCNDCTFMVRESWRFEQSLKQHHKWQLDYFETIKQKLIDKAKQHEKNNNLNKRDSCLKEADRMRFEFNKSTCMINYGHCSKFDKPVDFIPNTCQLDTQECFKHRKETI